MPISDPDECRAYQSQWMFERRERWFRNRVCADCGATKDLRLFRERATPLQLHNVWSYTEAKRKRELACCSVLCLKCWCARVGAGRRIYDGIRHGSIMGYKHYRCRCEECKRANRECVARQRMTTPRRSRHAAALDGALDALRSIWHNAMITNDQWTAQRAFHVLRDNVDALNQRHFTADEWRRLGGATDSLPGASVLAVDPSWSTPAAALTPPIVTRSTPETGEPNA